MAIEKNASRESILNTKRGRRSAAAQAAKPAGEGGAVNQPAQGAQPAGKPEPVADRDDKKRRRGEARGRGPDVDTADMRKGGTAGE